MPQNGIGLSYDLRSPFFGLVSVEPFRRPTVLCMTANALGLGGDSLRGIGGSPLRRLGQDNGLGGSFLEKPEKNKNPVSLLFQGIQDFYGPNGNPKPVGFSPVDDYYIYRYYFF